jgi:glutamate--cysteine ligase
VGDRRAGLRKLDNERINFIPDWSNGERGKNSIAALTPPDTVTVPDAEALTMPAPRPSLTLADAVAYCREHDLASPAQVFDTTTIGIELEWLTIGPGGGRLELSHAERIVAELHPLPSGSRLTIEPGGQLEISTATFTSVDDACAAAADDLFVLDQRCAADGVELVALGADPIREPERVVTAPRYRAMQDYFDNRGNAGRRMMCNTAALQVNVCLGDARMTDRWRLAHALGPTLIASFANSPLSDGGPSGWQSSRLRQWWLLDPSRSAPVPLDGDPEDTWPDYVLDAHVMLIRAGEHDHRALTEPMTFGQWLTNGHELGHATLDDLKYHLTTLFPPVRPKGWLELRMFDALPTPFWHIATAVTSVLLDDEQAADEVGRAVADTGTLWIDAAQLGLGHPALAESSRRCFAIALDALERHDAGSATLDVVAAFADRWPARGRSPADDRLDAWRTDGTLWPARESPVPYADELNLQGSLP